MGGTIDPYYEWLGIQPSEQPADYYRLLGLARFEGNPRIIERAADRQMGYVCRFQAKHPEEVSRLLSHISQAKLLLVDREKKLYYDKSLRNARVPTPPEKIEVSGRVWYLRSLGRTLGPFTSDQLQEYVKRNGLTVDALVRKGAGGMWMLAKEVEGLFDFPITSRAPAPGTRQPLIGQPAPQSEESDLLSGPLPEPENRDPGPNVWVCPGCRWPVPKKKATCPRCGYFRTLNEGRFTEQRTALLLLVLVAVVVLVVLLNVIN
jgi:hypothetical protein